MKEGKEEEEAPLTQMEGDTFGVASDGRWWKERRADGKKKRNCSQRVYHRRGACVGRWSVRWGWCGLGGGVGGFPRQWEILLFLKKGGKKRGEREKNLEETQTQALWSEEAVAIVTYLK